MSEIQERANTTSHDPESITLGDIKHSMDGFGLSMRHTQWLVAEVERSSKWKDAIIDACVVSWVLKKEHENNPKVSSEAKALHGRIAILEEENARLKALGESGNPTQAYA